MQQRGSITLDIWTDKGLKHSYMGILSKNIFCDRLENSYLLGFTLHFCDVDANLQRIFLGLKEIKGSHTGNLIRRETEKTLSEFGLSMEKLFKVVTDGASNMSKAFKDILPGTC